MEFQEDPLRPAVVVRGRRVHLALPVVREADAFDLTPEVRDVPLRDESRVLVLAHRGALGRQSEGVPAHRMEDVVALHAPLARHDVRRRVALRVTDVQARTGGVGEHVKDVVLGPALQDLRVVRRAEGLVLAPDLLPLRLDLGRVVNVPAGPRWLVLRRHFVTGTRCRGFGAGEAPARQRSVPSATIQVRGSAA